MPFILILAAGLLLQEPTVRSNIVSAPFDGWDQQAQETFLRNEKHSTYSAEIHYDLGLYFYEKGMYEMSLQHYRRAQKKVAPSKDFSVPMVALELETTLQSSAPSTVPRRS